MARKTDTPTFAQFWAHYPVHKDRKRAEQAWNQLSAADRRAALAALPAYIQDCQQNGIQYKYAQGWLNGRRWEDEPTLPQPLPSEVWGVPTATERELFRKAAQTDLQSEQGGTANPLDGMEMW